MKCQYCQHDMKWKERNGKCTKCGKPYALDPKSNDFKLHDARLPKILAKLSDNGRVQVPDDHLRFFLLRKQGDKDNSGGCLLFVLALLCAGSVSPNLFGESPALTAAAILLPASLLGLGLLLAFGRKPTPFPRRELKSLAALQGHLGKYTALHGRLPGLVPAAELPHRPEPYLPSGPLHAVVVCPSATVIDALRINSVAERHGVGLLCTTRVGPADDELVRRLRADPRLPILLFHDASPEGCVLAEDLPTRMNLQPNHRIVDLGLFPRRSIARKRLCLGVPVHEPSLARLRARSQTATSPAPQARPPARPLRPNRAALTDTELAWLAQGRTTPIESLMPRDLIQRVTAACARLAPKAADERATVRGFGFMSQPTTPT